MSANLKDLLAGAVKKGDFTLSSGKKSNYYVNIKEVYTDPGVLKEIAGEMAKSLAGQNIDKIAGVALGAVPLAVALSIELGVPFIIIRKDRKGHGTDLQIEGGLKSGDKVIMVEDVVTTGGSVIEGVNKIREKGGACDTVLAVIDREEGAFEQLGEQGIGLISLLTAEELLEDD